MIGVGFLDLSISINVWPWIWLGLAVVFTLIELAFIGGTFLLLPFALSSFIAAILAFYDVAVWIQWATFLGGGFLVLMVLLRWVRVFITQHTLPKGVGADRLVGATGIITTAVEPADTDRRGRVIVEGETWGALSKHDEPIPAGAKVRIDAIVGTRVVVEPIRNPTPDSSTDREDAT